MGIPKTRMFKTVFCLRNGHVETRYTVEWPQHLTVAALTTLAGIRQQSVGALFRELASEDVVEFCEDLAMIKRRAVVNSLDGPFVVTTSKKPSDAELIALSFQTQTRSIKL